MRSMRDGPTSPLSSLRRRPTSPKSPKALKSPGGGGSVRWGQGELFDRGSPTHGETSSNAAAAAAAAAAAVPPTRFSRARLDALARPPAGKVRQAERLIQHRHMQRQAQNVAHRNHSAKAAAAAAAAAAVAAAAAAPSVLVSATAQAAADSRRMQSLTVARSASPPPERVSSIFPPCAASHG